MPGLRLVTKQKGPPVEKGLFPAKSCLQLFLLGWANREKENKDEKTESGKQ